jgi:hypothetical protein
MELFSKFKTFTSIVPLLFSGSFAFAVTNSGITYHGRILNPDSSPVVDSNVQFKMQVRTPDSQNCLMYEEVQARDLSSSAGAFSITINDGTGSRTDSSGYQIDKIFGNYGTFSFVSTTCVSGSGTVNWAPNAGDGRSFVVSFKTPSMSTWEPLPSQSINFIPMAIEAKQVAGFPGASLFRVENGTGPQTVTSLSPAQATVLLNLAQGTTQYVTSTAAGAALPSFASNPATPVQGDVWYDSTNKVVKYYDGTSVQIVGSGGAVSGNSITSGTIGGSTSMSTTGTVTAASVSSTTDATQNLQIYNTGNTHKVTVTVPSALAADYSMQLPGALPTASNQVLVSDMSGVTSWSPAMTIASGKVGIGTTTPAGPLDVEGGNAAASTAGAPITFVGQNSTGPAANNGGDILLTTGKGSAAFPDGSVVVNVNPTNGGGAGSFQVQRGGNDGYTGSGSSFPRPNVISQLFNGFANDGNTAFQGYLVRNAPGSGGHNQYAYTGAVSSSLGSTYSPAMVFGRATGLNAYQESMRIDPNGNVGIGTTTPAGNLVVDNAGHNATICLNGTCATTLGGGGAQSSASNFVLNSNSDGTGTDGGFDFQEHGSSIFKISDNGGITTYGNITGNSALAVAAGGTNQNLALLASGTGSVNVGTGNGTGLSILDPGIGAANYVTVKGATAGSAPVIGTAGSDTNINLVLTPKGTGNVGIGTTSPSAPLEVNGTVRATSFNVGVGGGTSSFNAPINVLVYNGAAYTPTSGTAMLPASVSNFSNTNNLDGTAGLLTVAASDTSNHYSSAYFGAVSPVTGYSPSFVIGQQTSTSSYAERFRIDESGNVGIGTTTPASKLDVNGSIDIGSLNGISFPADTTAGGSVAVGAGTLASQSGLPAAAYGNTALGYQVLPNLTGTSSGANTAVGYQAFNQTTSGGGNTGLGVQPGYGNTSGQYNTYIGYEAGHFGNHSGDVAVGASALGNVGYAGGGNVSIGKSSGVDVTTGSNNIILGAYATTGVGITSGSNNILMGIDVRPASQTASGQLNIGNLIYATGLATGATASTGNVGIGTTTPAGNLAVDNAGHNATICLNGTCATTLGGGGAQSSASNFVLNSNSDGTGTDGGFDFQEHGSSIFKISDTGGITTYGNITGNSALAVAAGGANQNLALLSSGTGSVNVGTGNGTGLSVLDPGVGSANYVTVKGAAAGGAPVIGTAGSDTNINLVLTPKGTGNVGIGTTSPNGMLEVRQDNPIAWTTVNSLILHNDSDPTVMGGTSQAIEFLGNGNRAMGAIATGWDGSNNANTNMNFQIRNNGSLFTAQTINYTGQIGFNAGQASNIGFNIGSPVTSTSAGNGYGTMIQQTLKAYSNSDALNAVYINPTFNDNSKTGVTHNGLIVASGNVGIGTTAPVEKLQVVGTTRVDSSGPAQSTYINGGGLTAGATTVVVNDTTGYPTAGTLWIEREAMTYTGTTSTTFTGVTRGVYGTTAVTHNNGLYVFAPIMTAYAGSSRAMLLGTDGSLALGLGKTSGNGAVAFSTGTAVGQGSIAAGINAVANSDASMALGWATTAGGTSSFAANETTVTTGRASSAFGISTTANAYSSFVAGRFNVGGGTTSTWIATDPIFEIGIGTGTGVSAADAMTVLKNGNVGIGTTTPAGNLAVDNAGHNATICLNGTCATTLGGGGAQSSASNFVLNSNSDGTGTDGGFDFQEHGSSIFKISDTGGITTYGNITGNSALAVAAGGTNQNLALLSSGTGSVNVGTGNGTGLSVLDPGVGSTNYVTVKGATTGSAPVIGTAGSDTNINLVLTPKGTGNVGIGTTNPASSLSVNGSATIGVTSNLMASSNSTALGTNSSAIGSASFAAGNGNIVNNAAAIALGDANSVGGQWAGALGSFNTANGTSAIALGNQAQALGNNSMAIGLGTAAGTAPKVSGANSLGIFMGDQSGVNITANNVMSILGANVGIGTTTPSAPLDVRSNAAASAGVDYGMKVNQTLNQSGTAGWTGLLVNVDQTTVGSGSQRYLDLQYNGGSKFFVNVYGGFGAAGDSSIAGGLNVGGKVGIGTTTPTVSLDMQQKTDAIALPAGTTAQRPATPTNGMIRYNSDLSSFEGYANGQWVVFVSNPYPGTPPAGTGGTGYFVLSSGSINGNMGGLAGANSFCRTDLSSNTWLNKPGSLNTAKVFALLCDDSGCQNPTPNANFYFAVSGSATTGGAVMVTDSQGLFGDNNSFTSMDRFGGSANSYWIGDRGWCSPADTSTVANVTDNISCTNWSTSTAGHNAGYSTPSDSGCYKYSAYSASGDCSIPMHLFCFVNP